MKKILSAFVAVIMCCSLCSVCVNAADIKGTLTFNEGTLEVGSTGSVSFSASDLYNDSEFDQSNCTVTSSNESVATVSPSGGTVNYVGAGSFTLKLYYGGTLLDSKEGKVTAPVVKVTGLSISPSTHTMAIGETKSLNLTVSPDDATDKTVSWDTNASSIATVDGTGTVRAISVGTATITATANDSSGKTATMTVTVADNGPTGISLNKTSLTLSVNKRETLTATVTPSDAADKTVSWSTDNTAVAVVSDGLIVAKGPGTAKITATTVNGKSASCTVTVSDITVTKVTLNETSKTLLVGKTFYLKPTLEPSTADVNELTWKSSNSNIASVAFDGEVTAEKAGTAEITCTAPSGKKATCKVTVVNSDPITSISLSPSSKTIAVNETFRIEPSLSPSSASSNDITWKTSNSNVATVSSSGKVTGIGVGTATITATASSGVKSTCTVTVNNGEKVVTNLEASPTSKNIKTGESFTISTRVAPADAVDKSITFSSSDSSVASVSKGGTVKGLKAGTAVITISAASGVKTTCSVTVTGAAVTTAAPIVTQAPVVTQAPATTKAPVKETLPPQTEATTTAPAETTAAPSETTAAPETTQVSLTVTTVQTEEFKGGTVTATLQSENCVLAAKKGSMFALGYSVSDISAPLTWSSSDNGIVSSLGRGQFQAVQYGTVQITLTTTSGDTSVLTVKVVPSDAEMESLRGTFDAEVIRLINEQRANAGLAPVTLLNSVSRGAQMRADECGATGDISETRPSGESWTTALTSAVNASKGAENISCSTTGFTPEQLVSTWMSSESAKANILSQDLGFAGIGSTTTAGYDWSTGTYNPSYVSIFFCS